MIDPFAPDFDATPIAPARARLAFRPADPSAPPVVSIVTPFYRAGSAFADTATSLLGQSLQQWEWLVVDDASPEDEAHGVLERLTAEDPRVRRVRLDENRGRCAARNRGVALARAPFVYMLDQDDLLEPTALEKTAWLLATHPECHFANGWSAAFGGQTHLWLRGFERGEDFLDANQVTGRALIRRDSFEALGGYDESLREGFEDWDLWLRFADRGQWGATIPEVLDWFRRRDPPAPWESPERAEAFREQLRERYPALYDGVFPESPRPSAVAAPHADPPIPNRLAADGRRVVLVARRLDRCGLGGLDLSWVEALVRRGWHATVVVETEETLGAASELAAITPDVHVTSPFVPAAQRPAFVRSLVRSRGAELVLLEADPAGLALARWLRSEGDEAVLLGWPASDGADAARLSRDLDGVITPSAAPEPSGLDASRLHRLPLAVDGDRWRRDADARKTVRRSWQVDGERPVVLVLGRIDDASLEVGVLGATLRELERRGVDLHAVALSGGPARERLERWLLRHRLTPRIRLEPEDAPPRLADALSAADLVFVPARRDHSRWLLRAMAAGLPVVTSDVGDHRANFADGGARTVDADGERACVTAFADALAELAGDPEARERAGRRAEEHVRAGFAPDALDGALGGLLDPLPAACARADDAKDEARRAAVDAARSAGRAAAVEADRERQAWQSAIQQRRIRELEEARDFLERQVVSWREATAERERQLAEQKGWIAQLEDAKAWLEEQRGRWQELADEHAGHFRALEEGQRALGREIEEMAESWRAVGLREPLREIARSLRGQPDEQDERGKPDDGAGD